MGQLAAARQGSASTKTRGEVRGGGKKPYRQKGTGRARQGSTRAPQFAGGGTVHGPKPRSYDQRTPKKMKAAALRAALSDRARHDRVHVVVVARRRRCAVDEGGCRGAGRGEHRERTCCVVLERTDELTWKSVRNLTHVHVLEPAQLNTYDVLCSDEIVFTQAALDAFVSGPAKGKSAKGAASSDEVADADAVAVDAVDDAAEEEAV